MTAARWCDDTTRSVLGLNPFLARARPHSRGASRRPPVRPSTLDAWRAERSACLAVDAWHQRTPGETRAQVARALSDLPELDAVLSRVALQEPLRDVDLFALKRALLAARTLLEFAPWLANPDEIAKVDDALDLIHPEPRRTARFSLVDAHDPALANARADLKRTRRAWGDTRSALEDDLRHDLGPLDFDLHGVSRDPRLAQDPRSQAVGGGWRAWSQALEALEHDRDDASQAVTDAESQVRSALTRDLLPINPWLRDLEARALSFDLRWARVRLRHEIGGCWPEVADALSMQDAADPRIQDPQRVTFSMSSRPVVVVGPNMGGKSSLLKVVGLCQWCLEHVWPAPAAAFAAPRVQGLVYVGADEPRSDLVSAGLSAFGHEVHRVVQVAQSVPTPRLWLLDEFGRGTHPEEGAALGQALLRKLEARMDFVLASTHFTALAKLPDVDLWRVRGLRDAPSMPPDMDLTAALRANMDYRVEPARGDREIPRDAFTIAAWLNFDLI